MVQALIGLGSNLDDRERSLREAVQSIAHLPGIHRGRLSKIYETDPVGGPSGQGKYLNAVMLIETELSPQDLLDSLLKIEYQLGRQRSIKNAPRTIDLDLLFYGEQQIRQPGLTVPHPRLHERTFVLKPLCDLVPDFVHPGFGLPLKEMLKTLEHNKH